MLFSPNGETNMRTVTTPKGIAAKRINGIRLPSLCFSESDFPAIYGSVTASKIRPNAVMIPIAVSPINVPLGINRS